MSQASQIERHFSATAANTIEQFPTISNCVWALFQTAQREEEEGMLSEKETARPIKLLLTPDEAAQALGISRAKLYPMLMRGEIASMRIGGSRRVPLLALERFIDENVTAGCSSGQPQRDTDSRNGGP